jgi:hypothetical protein
MGTIMANDISTPTIPPFASPPAWNGRIPPLENGDRLTRAEFERRYDAMPHLKKAELIEGNVHMPSPVRLKQHGRPHFDIGGVLWYYQQATPGVEGADNASLRLDMDNEPQPDNALFIIPECGGQARVDHDDYLTGAPEFIAEISASTVSIDVGPKLQVYRRNRIQEYLVWRVLDQAIDWFAWRDGNYERLPVSPDGVTKSEVFPGLWLDVPALLRRDNQRVMEVLQEGLRSPEHQEFVRRLAAKRPASDHLG